MAFLPVLLLTFIAHSGLGASDEARRQEHNHRLSSILVHNNRASSLLSRFLGHEFAIPEEALRRGNKVLDLMVCSWFDMASMSPDCQGMAYMGSNHRLRAAVKRGMEGKQLKIGVIGKRQMSILMNGRSY